MWVSIRGWTVPIPPIYYDFSGYTPERQFSLLKIEFRQYRAFLTAFKAALKA